MRALRRAVKSEVFPEPHGPRGKRYLCFHKPLIREHFGIYVFVGCEVMQKTGDAASEFVAINVFNILQRADCLQVRLFCVM